MVWSSASSTLIGPFAFVVAFVFRSSPNTHPLRPVGAFGKALYRLRHSVSGSAPLRGRRGAHPYVAPCEFERYSPECVEGGFCELRRHGVLRSSHLAPVDGIMLVIERGGPWGFLQGGREGE